MVPPEQPRALADALKQVFDDPHEAQRRAQAGRALVQQEFENDVCLSRFESFLQRVIEEYPQQVPPDWAEKSGKLS